LKHASEINPISEDELKKAIKSATDELEGRAKRGEIEVSARFPKELALIKELGVTNLVYSYPFEEMMATAENMMKNTDPRDMFGAPYTRKQDIEHKRFLDAYRQWAAPVVKGLEGFSHAYPASGSSEPLKDTLALAKAHNPEMTLHVFEGEYEGAVAYAEALNIKVVRHPRTSAEINQLVHTLGKNDYFYLSQPSSLDGNVWTGFDAFMKATQPTAARPDAPHILVDLAYVGAVVKDYSVDLSYPHIESVFFSLSKVFGTYYMRIGGLFSRKENPLEFGNRWFKNIPGLRIGTELLNKYDVYAMPRTYLWAQTASLQRLSRLTGLPLQASDVVLLANLPTKQDSSFAKDYSGLYRGGTDGFLRFCLTPTMMMISDQTRKADRACADLLVNK
jgi:hypothetical protein